MTRHKDGYRYIRSYRCRGAWRYAAWLRILGRARRVGTFLDYAKARAFLAGAA